MAFIKAISYYLPEKVVTNEELVKEAVREAVFKGVSNLRYIDKILYEQQKKGIKNKNDVEKNREAFRKKEKEEPVEEELFDYNWFEDEDDEQYRRFIK